MAEKKSANCSTGTIEGTGSDLVINCGFKPKQVFLFNVDGNADLTWNDTMANAYGFKRRSDASAVEAPQVVYEESVTAASNVATLTFLPAHITYISNDTKAFIIVDKDTTPGAGEVAVDFSTGELTFAAADSNPTAFVTYHPKLSNKVLSDNLVESDLVDATPASGHASLSSETITITDMAAAIISVDVDGTPFKPVIDDDTPGTGEYALNFDDSGNTTLVGSGSEFSGATAIKITFIKDPGTFNYIEDASAHSSDVVTLDTAFYLLRTSCYLFTDDNDVPHTIRNNSETLSANEVKLDIRAAAGVRFTYHADTDVAASGIPFVSALPTEIAKTNVNQSELITSNGITPGFNHFTLGADTDLNVSGETIFWVALK